MTRELSLKLVNILGEMDEVIRGYGDEEVFEPWLMCGVPDGADLSELASIAEDLGEMADICECFARRLRQIAEQ